MPKNIAFFADGTGNSKTEPGKLTNIAKLYDLARNDAQDYANAKPADLDALMAKPDFAQVTSYDAGVGWEFGDIIGKATGSGISRNIRDGYQFLIQFYEPGDRIFLFGFSRGAYTARSLGGMLGILGLPKRQQGNADLRHDAAARAQIANAAYAIYKIGAGKGEAGKQDRLKAAAEFRARFAWAEHQGDTPREREMRAPFFIGVFDTVRSLGLPIGWKDWELSLWPHRFHDHDLNPYVRYAFHALAIDDPRLAFHPTIWNEPTVAQQAAPGVFKQEFEQVWFPGVHSDIGGGYADTALSDVTLRWMIERSLRPATPLLFKTDPLAGINPDPIGGKLHDPRDSFFKKIGYRVQMRNVVKGVQPDPSDKRIEANGDADLHQSFVERMNNPSYDPSHMAQHPDYRRAIAERKANRLPLSPPWKAVRP